MSKKMQRSYIGSQKVDSDLFRLKLAKAQKNVAWGDVVRLEDVPHTHFFRTYDSDGKKLTMCASVAGHFHTIEYEDSADGVAKIKSVSKAQHMVRRKIKGQWKNVVEFLPEHLEDEHTHEIEYLMSTEVDVRQANPNAIQMIGADAIKGQSIPGVAG